MLSRYKLLENLSAIIDYKASTPLTRNYLYLVKLVRHLPTDRYETGYVILSNTNQ